MASAGLFTPSFARLTHRGASDSDWCRMFDHGKRLDDADWEQRPVVEIEFREGPLNGRRMLGPGGVRLLFFAGFGSDRRPLLTTSMPASGAALGRYAFEAAFESDERHECVVVLRWGKTDTDLHANRPT